MFTKKFVISIGGAAAAAIIALGAYSVSLKRENNFLKLHPLKVKIIETATPTSTPSATPTFYFRRITPTLKVK